MTKITIKKYVTNINKLYTYFEFVPCDHWDYFEPILSIFTDHLGYRIEEEVDGIWSRHCTLRKGDFIFDFAFQDYYGNCLFGVGKQDEDYYAKLEQLANEVAEGISTNRYGLQKNN